MLLCGDSCVTLGVLGVARAYGEASAAVSLVRAQVVLDNEKMSIMHDRDWNRTHLDIARTTKGSGDVQEGITAGNEETTTTCCYGGGSDAAN